MYIHVPGIKTVIYMVSLQNKFQEQNEILDRKGSNYLIYFLFLSLLNWIKMDDSVLICHHCSI